MSIPVVPAAQGSPAPGASGVVLSAVFGDHDKVLARGPHVLGEWKGTAAVPSGSGRRGTVEGGQESRVCTPRQVLQLPSRRGQTLLGHGHAFPPPARVMAAILLPLPVTPTHA